MEFRKSYINSWYYPYLCILVYWENISLHDAPDTSQCIVVLRVVMGEFQWTISKRGLRRAVWACGRSLMNVTSWRSGLVSKPSLHKKDCKWLNSWRSWDLIPLQKVNAPTPHVMSRDGRIPSNASALEQWVRVMPCCECLWVIAVERYVMAKSTWMETMEKA